MIKYYQVLSSIVNLIITDFFESVFKFLPRKHSLLLAKKTKNKIETK
ncbi:hypothetical protein CCAND93_1030003 [Capnocytophaga canis]|uniref:Uncharacterized protein n=1 Tax=Capnocytophaga canis TaxID=1848903 RepID=A0A0B7IEE8_9FLAO|nr:hypothetical protein CCAND93_1030003 [Capnocytophaga canis]